VKNAGFKLSKLEKRLTLYALKYKAPIPKDPIDHEGSWLREQEQIRDAERWRDLYLSKSTSSDASPKAQGEG